MPFQPGNKGGPKNPREFAAMLKIALASQGESGQPKLREVAEKLVDQALAGEGWAIKEIADRTDGKVPQAIVGDSEHDPIGLNIDAERFTRAIIGLASRDETPESD